MSREENFTFSETIIFAKTFTQSKILIKFVILVHCRHFSQIFFTRSKFCLKLLFCFNADMSRLKISFFPKNFAWSRIFQKKNVIFVQDFAQNCHYVHSRLSRLKLLLFQKLSPNSRLIKLVILATASWHFSQIFVTRSQILVKMLMVHWVQDWKLSFLSTTQNCHFVLL